MAARDKTSAFNFSEEGIADKMLNPAFLDKAENNMQHANDPTSSNTHNVKENVLKTNRGQSSSSIVISDNVINTTSKSDGVVNYQSNHDGQQSKDKSVQNAREELRGVEPEAMKKSKLVWDDALHKKFLEAVTRIGAEKAVPKNILEYMNVPGLTREKVGSHLQKYRLYLKRVIHEVKTHGSLSLSVLRSNFASSLPKSIVQDSVARLRRNGLTLDPSTFIRSWSKFNNPGASSSNGMPLSGDSISDLLRNAEPTRQRFTASVNPSHQCNGTLASSSGMNNASRYGARHDLMKVPGRLHSPAARSMLDTDGNQARGGTSFGYSPNVTAFLRASETLLGRSSSAYTSPSIASGSRVSLGSRNLLDRLHSAGRMPTHLQNQLGSNTCFRNPQTINSSSEINIASGNSVSLGSGKVLNGLHTAGASSMQMYLPSQAGPSSCFAVPQTINSSSGASGINIASSNSASLGSRNVLDGLHTAGPSSMPAYPHSLAGPSTCFTGPQTVNTLSGASGINITSGNSVSLESRNVLNGLHKAGPSSIPTYLHSRAEPSTFFTCPLTVNALSGTSGINIASGNGVLLDSMNALDGSHMDGPSSIRTYLHSRSGPNTCFTGPQTVSSLSGASGMNITSGNSVSLESRNVLDGLHTANSSSMPTYLHSRAGPSTCFTGPQTVNTLAGASGINITSSNSVRHGSVNVSDGLHTTVASSMLGPLLNQERPDTSFASLLNLNTLSSASGKNIASEINGPHGLMNVSDGLQTTAASSLLLYQQNQVGVDTCSSDVPSNKIANYTNGSFNGKMISGNYPNTGKQVTGGADLGETSQVQLNANDFENGYGLGSNVPGDNLTPAAMNVGTSVVQESNSAFPGNANQSSPVLHATSSVDGGSSSDNDGLLDGDLIDLSELDISYIFPELSYPVESNQQAGVEGVYAPNQPEDHGNILPMTEPNPMAEYALDEVLEENVEDIPADVFLPSNHHESHDINQFTLLAVSHEQVHQASTKDIPNGSFPHTKNPAEANAPLDNQERHDINQFVELGILTEHSHDQVQQVGKKVPNASISLKPAEVHVPVNPPKNCDIGQPEANATVNQMELIGAVHPMSNASHSAMQNPDTKNVSSKEPFGPNEDPWNDDESASLWNMVFPFIHE